MTQSQDNLKSSPFSAQHEPAIFIAYRSQREAAEFLLQTYNDERGFGMLCGPTLSGKSTVIRQFIKQLPTNASVAVVNGATLDARSFLESTLYEFGLRIEGESVTDMLKMVSVFGKQKIAAGQAPLLVIDNFPKMKLSAIHIVGELAKLTSQGRSLLKFILVSSANLKRLHGAPALKAINARSTGEHELGAMTRAESSYYLAAKLRQAGIASPEVVFPTASIDRLFDATGGRPGLLDRGAAQHLADQRESRQITAGHARNVADKQQSQSPTVAEAVAEPFAGSSGNDSPRLIITKDGATIGSIAGNKSRILIGRSYNNDITIESDFVSRHHALLSRSEGGTVITDLNSTNGIFVNSRRVFKYALKHNDIISVGNHRIKLYDPAHRQRVTLDDLLADTRKMKALHDVRKMHLQQDNASKKSQADFKKR